MIEFTNKIDNNFGELNILFKNDEKAIRVSDLQGFLFYMDMYYWHFTKHLNQEISETINQIINQSNITNDDIKRITSNYQVSLTEYQEYFKLLHKDNREQLFIKELDKHSPLKMVIVGSFIGLFYIAALTGGEIRIETGRVKITIVYDKSLGEVLNEMRKFKEKGYK